MKPRKTREIQKVLEKKGFILEPEKDHHQFYLLVIDGKKQAIKTYFSHGKKEYDKFLMGQIKKQLKFRETEKAEDFFDCPMTKEQYVEMLIELGEIQKKK
ncbi:MAG: type II toxin-antitoxin system HicA family toxin [Bacteroidota bacterium]|nr:type II toxin-antitoxin system HicA family toxin [Bacteroidota bacterium]MDO9614690.1 type II toxin-antitoxin system HicA family toxin [Bacteroidota bacterium]MDP2113095.1 type II toxin-antitoxin system HicA family toxin [Bacteroidota bacterium]MDP3432658.1 type II toxin-antitoxin system HicA family toxin [Bacteroidota bacterium]